MAINVVLNPLASLTNQSTAISLINNNFATLQSALGQSVFVAPSNSIGMMRFAAIGVNFNSANTDTQVAMLLPTGISRYRINSMRICNASVALSPATVGLFTAAAGGGISVIPLTASTITSAATDTNNNMQIITPANSSTQSFNDMALFIRVGTAKGSAATADVILIVDPLS